VSFLASIQWIALEIQIRFDTLTQTQIGFSDSFILVICAENNPRGVRASVTLSTSLNSSTPLSTIRCLKKYYKVTQNFGFLVHKFEARISDRIYEAKRIGTLTNITFAAMAQNFVFLATNVPSDVQIESLGEMPSLSGLRLANL
jgi:hypothetical protein